MNKEEMIIQIKSLIEDRKSFITDDKETSEEFEKDVEALEMILNKYNELSLQLDLCKSVNDEVRKIVECDRFLRLTIYQDKKMDNILEILDKAKESD